MAAKSSAKPGCIRRFTSIYLIPPVKISPSLRENRLFHCMDNPGPINSTPKPLKPEAVRAGVHLTPCFRSELREDRFRKALHLKPPHNSPTCTGVTRVRSLSPEADPQSPFGRQPARQPGPPAPARAPQHGLPWQPTNGAGKLTPHPPGKYHPTHPKVHTPMLRQERDRGSPCHAPGGTPPRLARLSACRPHCSVDILSRYSGPGKRPDRDKATTRFYARPSRSEP